MAVPMSGQNAQRPVLAHAVQSQPDPLSKLRTRRQRNSRCRSALPSRWAVLGKVPAGPLFANQPPMNALAFRVNRKNGDYVKPTIVPAHGAEESHFSAMDGAIATFFLLCVSGLMYMLLS